MSTSRLPAQVLADLGLDIDDLQAWQESGLPVESFEDWVTDRLARRPSGPKARETYGAEDIHNFARSAILDALDLDSSDHLLEVGCGGGLLLQDALATGAFVTGIDHSEDMVALAQRRLPDTEIAHAEASSLPFPDLSFTAAAMSVVFLFFDSPETVLSECKRVLTPGGRVAIYTIAPELRGTPAAPEPVASRAYFYNDTQLAELATRAGLTQVNMVNDNGGQLLTAVT